MTEKNIEVYYSLDGEEILSITINDSITVSEFIGLISTEKDLSDLNSAYLKGRQLDPDVLLVNFLTDRATDVVFLSDDPELDPAKIPVIDFFDKIEKEKVIEDQITGSSHGTLDENDITPKVNRNNFRVYTTATEKSLLEGDRMVFKTSETFEEINEKIRNHVQSLVPGIPDDFEIHIYLPGGTPFIPGDNPNLKKLDDFFLAAEHSWNRMYVVVTKKLGDFVKKNISEPCNCTKKYKNMLSPLFESSEAGLTQIASFLGYVFHGGFNAEHLMLIFGKITCFAPLFINVFRLLERSQLTTLNIISITAPLFTLFKSLLPKKVKNENVFEYTLQVLTYIGKIRVTDFLDLRTIDLDQDPISEDENLMRDFLKDSDQKHIIFWGGDIESDAYEGIILEKPPTDMFTDKKKSIFNLINTFEPVAPLSLHYIHYPTFISARKNKVLLFIKEITAKEGWIEYIDPNKGSVEEILIDDLADNLHNSDEKDFISSIDGNVVDQIIVICFDESTSMKFKLEGGNKIKEDDKTRKEIATEFLHALVEQSYKLRVSSIYGLIGFHDDVEVIQELTTMSSKFLDGLKEVRSKGYTALYDALNKAQEMILKLTKPKKVSDDGDPIYPFPNAKLRIIVISDGSDTKSRHSPSELADSLIKNGIIVDTVIVGLYEKNQMMCNISKLTGGVCFQPTSINEGLKIFEQEAFINIKKRQIDPPSKRPITKEFLKDYDFNDFDKFTKNQTIILANSKIQLASPLYMNYLYQTERHIKTMRSRRALLELNIIGHNENDNYVVYSSYSTPEEWRIFIKGPKKTPFANKWLNCFMVLSSSYPTTPPSFKFLTIPFHPNVSQEGTIMFSLIDNDYSPKVGIDAIINAIIDILKKPDKNSIINKEAYHLFKKDKDEYYNRQKAGERGKADYHDYIKGVKIFDEVPDDADISRNDRIDLIFMTNNHNHEGKRIPVADVYD